MLRFCRLSRCFESLLFTLCCVSVGFQDVLSHFFSPCVAFMDPVPARAYQGISSLILQICETPRSAFVVKGVPPTSETKMSYRNLSSIRSRRAIGHDVNNLSCI